MRGPTMMCMHYKSHCNLQSCNSHMHKSNNVLCVTVYCSCKGVMKVGCVCVVKNITYCINMYSVIDIPGVFVHGKGTTVRGKTQTQTESKQNNIHQE